MSEQLKRFMDLLRRGSQELYEENRGGMTTPLLRPTVNVIDEDDLRLFFQGLEAGLIELQRGARFNTVDRPTSDGHWGLLSRAKDGGWYNAEYLPQLAAYVEAILELGYDRNRVLFELPGSALRLDLAILDDDGRVAVLGEAKRDNTMLDRLLNDVIRRFGNERPSEESKKRGDEARQLAWRVWTVRPELLWLIGPGHRTAWRCAYEPLRFDPLGDLPSATETGMTARPDKLLPPPDLQS